MSSNFQLPRTLKRNSHLSGCRTVRVVMLGQGAVGKTAISVRFITKRFIGEYDPTLETIYRHVSLVDGECVQFEVLDTAGQEEDAMLIEEKIKWAEGFVIVYSVTDRCSFDEVVRLRFLINHVHAGLKRAHADTSPPVVVVANKKDLQYDRMVTEEEGGGVARALNCPFFEISARDSYEETVAVFTALYHELANNGTLSAFRRKVSSKLMDKMPRIPSTATMGLSTRSFSLSSVKDF
ncbi:ras-related and estrogen-regulated growth inhibitor [Callorhinchus milii]|uniref:small monomeric GTPase n=1 Tax=Callorhinchus milii TaxID=7868 RepID=V9KXV6_CALMI|nr:ras-related and estrogen-regulated growth inhibitor [Callorhinchus milii]|eukprot:gi/632991301/ref/XP_007884566.1/ PREDICTED: ras-related and estrogen-regulated growth inhibitor-like [Callorhinchus milii]